LVQYTATDAAGLTSTCNFDVQVNDNQAPVITCPASLSVSNSVGACGANVSFAVTATDNCGTPTIVTSANSGSTFAVGTTTVNATATDANGLQSTCSFDVTVNDTELPTINCNASLSVSNSVGVCGAAVTYSVTSNDNCAGSSVAQTAGLASGATFPIGTTTNSFTVTDASNNTATCSFTVTVNDTEAPTITCPAPMTFNASLGSCSSVVTYQVGSSANVLYGTDASGFIVRAFDANTLAQISTVPMVVPGLPAGQNFGMAKHPISGVVYAVAGSNSARSLITLNPVTGAGVLIGPTGLLVSSIAFDNAGNLYAVTGNSGPTAGKLYSLNLSTGAATLGDEPDS
jgi:hypothetical protein